MNETAKIYSFGMYAASTDEDRLRIMRLARKIPCKIITKKVNIYVHVVAFCYAA